MTDWVTIEDIAFRGGPGDGNHLKDVGAAGLVTVISVPADEGAAVRYRKTDEYVQVRGLRMVESYSRTWFYDWLPDPDATAETH